MAAPSDDADLAQPDPTTRTGPSLLQVAWQRKSLVLLGLMVGLLLGLLYFAQRPPVYASSAQILVVKKTPVDSISLSQGADGRYLAMDDYISTQSVLLKSPVVIGRAAQLPDMKELRSFPNVTDQDGELTNVLREALTVTRDSRETAGGVPNSVLTLGFRGPIADECPKVLRNVVSSYQDFLNEAYRNVSDKTVDLIMKAHDTLENSLAKKRADYELFRQKTPILLYKGASGANIYTERLGKIEARRAELRIKHVEQQQNYALIKRTNERDGKGVALQTLIAIGVKVPLLEGSAALDKELIQLTVLHRMKAQAMGPNHPDVRALAEQIDLVKRMYGRGLGYGLMPDITSVPQAKDTNGSPGNPPVEMDLIQTILAAMQAETDNTKTLLENLDILFEREQKDARDLTQAELEDTGHKEKIESARKTFDQILNKVQEMQLVKDAGGFDAKLIHPPGLGRKIAPSAVQVFPVSAVLGLIAGVGLAYLAEMSDKSFRTPADIRRRLGLPVIGHVPFFGPDEKAAQAIASGQPGVDPMIITHHQSNSIGAEAYRGVRTALYFNTQGVGHQVIQVTSPNVSDGKSTLAANLAVSIAQSGKRTSSSTPTAASRGSTKSSACRPKRGWPRSSPARRTWTLPSSRRPCPTCRSCHAARGRPTRPSCSRPLGSRSCSTSSGPSSTSSSWTRRRCWS